MIYSAGPCFEWPACSRKSRRGPMLSGRNAGCIDNFLLAAGPTENTTPMSADATLSVVLPNYNHGKLIGRALRAFTAQERTPDEIIVIDDASTDDSLRVIEGFAADSPAVKLLRNAHNIGVIPTLERGLRTSRGKYVYFAAADDFVLPGFFETALQRLEANPDLGLFCGEAVLVEGRTNRPFAIRPAVWPRMSPGRVDPARVRQLLETTDNWILTGSSVLRRECVLWAGGLDNRLGPFADGMLGRKLALKFGFFFEPKPMAAWVVFSASQSRSVALDLNKTKHFLDAVPNWIAADSDFPAWYADKFRDRWRFGACRLVLQERPLDREFIFAVGARSTAEIAAIKKVMTLPDGVARTMVLALLWYRLRPIALTALLRTMFASRIRRLAFGRRQVRSQTASGLLDAGVDEKQEPS
jgi:glycosyltransferase involved in cell wall biosynthesis